MPYDQQRYNSLISRCAFDMSAYTGSFQDRSPAQRTMTAVGAPTWGRVNGVPALSGSGGIGATTGALASIINTTLPFWIEILFRWPQVGGFTYQMFQVNAGGWSLVCNGVQLQLYTYTAAPANARYVTSPAASFRYGYQSHAIAYIDPVGLSGAFWINGVPGVATFTNTNPPAVCANTAFTVGTGQGSMIARVWQGTPTNEDCVTLYQAAKTLVGGEI